MTKEILKIVTVSRRKKSGGLCFDIDLSHVFAMIEEKQRWEEKFRFEGIEQYSFREIDDTHLEVKYTLEM